MTQLVQIIYVSTASPLLTAADVGRIAAMSEQANLRDGITGVLLFRGGRFVQVLEGPVPAVDACFERIAMDDRHHDLVRILRAPVESRSFPHWSMRVVHFDGAPAHEHGHAVSEFFGALRTAGNHRNPMLAATLLRQLNVDRATDGRPFS